MASARAFRNRHVLGNCDSDMGCITQRVGDPLRAEPFMPGTHRTSTYSSRGIRTALGSSGALMQQGFVGRLAVSCKIRTRSFDERPAFCRQFPSIDTRKKNVQDDARPHVDSGTETARHAPAFTVCGPSSEHVLGQSV